jgi:hypothetical protein
MRVLGYALDPKTVMYMLFNFVVSVGIVFANKYVFHHFHFDFATLMTALHFFGEYRVSWTDQGCAVDRPDIARQTPIVLVRFWPPAPPHPQTMLAPQSSSQRRGWECW